LRAASFGLGALQALQQRLGLLRGERAARYLSAVSGGSYIAGAYTLANRGDSVSLEGGGKGAAPTPEQPPFAPDSPEAEHLRRHCRYMAEEGALGFTLGFLVLIVFNLCAVIAVVAFAGVYLGDGGAFTSLFLPNSIGAPDGTAWMQWALVAAGFATIFYLGRDKGVPKERSDTRPLLGMATGLLLALATAPIMARLDSVPVLSEPAWVSEHARGILVVLGGVLGFVALTALLGAWLKHVALLPRLRRFGISLLTRWLILVVGALLVSWVATATYRLFTHPELDPPAWKFGLVLLAFAGPLFASKIIDRGSPHFVYRDRLNRCFSIVRDRDGGARPPRDPRAIKLTDLMPPPPGCPDSYPELLICAAVNVSDVGATPAGSNVLSCVFCGGGMEVPEVRDARVEMKDLELLRRPTRFGPGWGPAVNLASAVAMTGAAISPAMGKRTVADLRALFAVFDVRLGVWLPNLINEDIRAELPKRAEKRTKVKVGVRALIREIFGWHSERAKQIYVTDGGHYDNLGLIELLRARCEEVWCIDASGDKPGHATALSEAVLTASGELGVHIEIDLDRFARLESSPLRAPVLKNTHANGWIHYPDGAIGRLHVVKLGITERTPSVLREYRRSDRRFPHHSTINQIYRAERFDAYRDLGWASTQEALESEGYPDPALSVPVPAPTSDGKDPVPAG
jgi:hypothetical protein